MSNSKIKFTEQWAIQQVKAGKPVISDNIVPTLKEKGMKLLRKKLSKRGIQVWWSQAEPSDVSVILPRTIKPEIFTAEGYKAGMIHSGNNVTILPTMFE